MTELDSPGEWTQAAAPNWELLRTEVLCPMCEYNLRGLTDPRCPECGFSFTWAELENAARSRHPYLFEHQNKRNTWSLWKTYWADCRPKRFWTQLSPANPVRVGRLLLYWILANTLILASLINPLITSAIRTWQTNSVATTSWKLSPDGTHYDDIGPAMMNASSSAVPMTLTIAQYAADYPPLVSLAFLEQSFNNVQFSAGVFGAIGIFLAWPWMTFLALLIFQTSMKRARTRSIHVLRCAIYGCDFGFLLLFMLPIAWVGSIPGFWSFTLLSCALIALYRMSIAYRRYIRFDHPFLTILASQAIVSLAVLGLIMNVTEYWRVFI